MWKDIANTNYRVSDTGQVMNIKTGKILKQGTRNKKGYKCVDLCVNGIRKTYSVHRLVAEAFIPNPEGKPDIDHINDDPGDNRVENIRWVTKLENNAKEHRARSVSESLSKLIIETNTNTNEIRMWKGLKSVAEFYKVRTSTIGARIRNNIIVKGLKWEYAN